MFFTLGNMGFLSPDGVSHSFDSRAKGYGRGEGVAALILKPVRNALRDGDTIRAVIRNTCTNQNGLTPLAVPSKQLQQRLIQKTYHEAGLDMSRTKYVEAHGTGTAVGDPLEAMAIGETFGPGRSSDDPIVMGAIKANIGYLEGAAGIAGIIKAILVLERGLIPPIAQLDKLNEDIDDEFLKLHFPRKAQPWPGSGLRRASVNSFGFGGTNAHAVLDDAMHYLEEHGLVGCHSTNDTGAEIVASSPLDHDLRPLLDASAPKLFVFSGNTQRAVERILEATQIHIEAQSPVDSTQSREFLGALAHTLSTRRSLHTWRVSVAADTVPDLTAQLALARASVTKTRSHCKVGFVFTGQGAQWYGMGRELAVFPVFRESIMTADSFLCKELGSTWSAANILLSSDDHSHSTVSLAEPRIAQPLCTILQIALVEVLRSLGISPSAVVGHSSGEIAAAYATGAITRESAWKLAYFRGVLSNKIAEGSSEDGSNWPRGAMMAVGLSEEAVRRHIDGVLKGNPGGVLVVACVNSPRNVTISGDIDLVEALQTSLKPEGVFARFLKVPVAYHSPHMERLSAEYLDLVGHLHPADTRGHYAVMISSVTGKNVSGHELRNADYWVHNLVSTVRFSDAIGRLCRNATMKERKKLDLSHRDNVAVSYIIELGPHATLQGPVRECVQDASTFSAAKINVNYTSALLRGRSAMMTLLEAMGKLHCAGADINLTSLNAPAGTKNTPMVLPTLPPYPFDHGTRYWFEPRISRNLRTQSQVYSEFLGAPVADLNPLEPCWRNMLRVSTMPWIADHVINGEVLFPAAGMIVMAVEAMAQIAQGRDRAILAFEIRDMRVLAALTLPADDDSLCVETQLRLRLTRDPGDKASAVAGFTLFSISSDDVFTEVCHGSIRAEFATPSTTSMPPVHRGEHLRRRISDAATSYGSQLEKPAIFHKLWANGYHFGSTFQGIDWTRRDGKGRSISMVGLQEPTPLHGSPAPTIIHPAALDRVLHTTLPPIVRTDDGSTGTWIPTFVRRIRLPGARIQEDAVLVLSAAAHMNKRLCIASAEALGDQGSFLDLQGIELTMVSADEIAAEEDLPQKHPKRLCFDMLYEPDVDLLDSKHVANIIGTEPSGPAKSTLVKSALQRYIELLAHKRPSMTILQIGAGGGPMAECIFRALMTKTPHGTLARFSQYHVVDSGQEVPDQALQLFDGVSAKVHASTFDAELDPATLTNAKYDLVIVTSRQGVLNLETIRELVKE